jgi:hypothetical protein
VEVDDRTETEKNCPTTTALSSASVDCGEILNYQIEDTIMVYDSDTDSCLTDFTYEVSSNHVDSKSEIEGELPVFMTFDSPVITF